MGSNYSNLLSDQHPPNESALANYGCPSFRSADDPPSGIGKCYAVRREPLRQLPLSSLISSRSNVAKFRIRSSSICRLKKAGQ